MIINFSHMPRISDEELKQEILIIKDEHGVKSYNPVKITTITSILFHKG